MKFSDVFEFKNKSGIKAGEGLEEGRYFFYTSSDEQTKFLNEYLFDSDALIFGTGGNASVHFTDQKFAVSTDCLVVQPRDKRKVYAKFYYYFLRGNMRILERGFKGAGLKHISKSYISAIELPKEDFDRQITIVEILDQADALRQKRKQSLQLLDDFLRATFLEMFGDSYKNPMKWKTAQLDEVCKEIYRYPTFYGFEYVEMGIPVVKIGNILRNGFVNPDLSDYSFISEEINLRYPRTILERNDIVMAVRGDGSTVKRIGLVAHPNLVGANISPNLLRFNSNQKIVSPFYLFMLVTSESGQKMLEKYITQTAKKTITATDIKQIKVPVPPLDLQSKFEKVFIAIQDLKERSKQSIEQMDNQFNALMQKYFS